ncbi:FAD-dependent oxidoreductase [Chryseolinea sp. Jin1]|uniref:FAD-dependent oxidoreductase n=2 Tax=Chryseolinea lacunae TaxID=2801331 RepID=A0ABS1L5G5_9BACT|nr:FAD-dependent oxidoreductase [Chryseolinea lacunae]MBL0745791.1 FAD-dependent oxidoreductase [Chryseolinea lacunae]
MIREGGTMSRTLNQTTIFSDLVIVGGGMAGTCCAISAAREGLKVTLVQDRPVLGGNASSEVRLWVLGATSHMGNNNRWAREGGVIDEILVENMYRNREGNAVIFDTILLDKVVAEANITLLLNTSVYQVEKNAEDNIASLIAFCSQNSTEYRLHAPLFCDASGDGIIAFLSGAPFHMGAEKEQEWDEKFAPSKEYGELLGHSLYFYTKDTGKPVRYVPPCYAMRDIAKIPRYRQFNTHEHGCKLWWIEYGGRLDTVHETESIKWQLWKVVYGVWDYIKNSGNFPDAENLTLEWVGTIPGKRESRRFLGDYVLTQQDIVQQHQHEDAVAYGGWSVDLHPADGVFSDKPGCNQWHSKGIYQIPYRCYYSNAIQNLFLAGRIISVSHVAFGSTRVMGTSAYGGQAVAMAASLCHTNKLKPRAVGEPFFMKKLQRKLMESGHHIPGIVLDDSRDLARQAVINASSELQLTHLPVELNEVLDTSVAQMIPVGSGPMPSFFMDVIAECSTVLKVELRVCSRMHSYSPDVTLGSLEIPLQKGVNNVPLNFNLISKVHRYIYLTFLKNPSVMLPYTAQRMTGILTVYHHVNPAVSNFGTQTPPKELGFDAFEFWTPKRRPKGHNLALKFNTPLGGFEARNICNGLARPTIQPNAWAASLADKSPSITLEWDAPKEIQLIVLKFDTDFDHPMETVLMGHPEDVMPFCVQHYIIRDENGKVIYAKRDNYQTINKIKLASTIKTKKITIEVSHPSQHVPAAIFEILCYGPCEKNVAEHI